MIEDLIYSNTIASLQDVVCAHRAALPDLMVEMDAKYDLYDSVYILAIKDVEHMVKNIYKTKSILDHLIIVWG